MPRHKQRRNTVSERIRLPTGGTSVIMIDEKYMPYTPQPAKIENICGSFRQAVFTQGLDGVLFKTNTCFGKQHELYHLQGNVTLNGNKASFMGARSMHGIEQLARALSLETPQNIVHMVVVCTKLGKRVQVSPNGLLESRIARWSEQVHLEGRMMEQNNTVRIRIIDFTGPFALPREMIPENNDCSVTGRGTVLTRFTWRRIEWSQEVESACLALCNSMAAWLTECS